jgi:hypothetical protein
VLNPEMRASRALLTLTATRKTIGTPRCAPAVCAATEPHLIGVQGDRQLLAVPSCCTDERGVDSYCTAWSVSPGYPSCFDSEGTLRRIPASAGRHATLRRSTSAGITYVQMHLPCEEERRSARVSLRPPMPVWKLVQRSNSCCSDSRELLEGCSFLHLGERHVLHAAANGGRVRLQLLTLTATRKTIGTPRCAPAVCAATEPHLIGVQGDRQLLAVPSCCTDERESTLIALRGVSRRVPAIHTGTYV